MEANVLHCGDNLEIMRGMEEGEIDLIYADPPFNTGRDWGAFNDKWEDGLKGYLKFMEPRLVEMHRLLKETGSIYLHCDPNASHYLKVMMDGIFGMKHFRNEIVWCYTQGGRPQQDFANKHEIILRYAKSLNYIFNANSIKVGYELLSDKSSDSFTKVDENGRYYKEVFGSDRKKKYRYYKDEGKTPYDWWVIPKITGRASMSQLAYPTQKPIALLERIIKASSNQGDVVLDPFCGSGTTLRAAKTLGRKYIGIDQNPEAIRISENRLNPPQQELFTA